MQQAADPRAARVLLADGHPLVLDALRRLVECDPAADLVGVAENAAAALEACASSFPDLLMLDSSLPGLPAAELVRQVAERCPQTRVLVLTGWPDGGRLCELRAAGAAGCLAMTKPVETIQAAMRLVALGGEWFPDAALNGRLPLGNPCPALTQREHEVLGLLVQGLTDKEIAERVGVSDRAVRYAVRTLYDKLGVDGRVQAAVRAVRLGLTGEG